MINIIGAGLAGCEAAWQAAKRGVRVKLYEMKPEKFSPAHSNENFAELVCSNSFKAQNLENATGLLKKELETGGSLIMEAAYKTQVPAGGALAVDREHFSGYVTRKIRENNNIEVINGEVRDINLFKDGNESNKKDEIVIIATGPLTSESLQESIKDLLGEEYLSFFDAAAPIVSLESINFESAFYASRYNKGGKDYINCPLSEEEYKRFYHELINAESVRLRDFEHINIYEGCIPVEITAKRGEQTLLFGCMKPVGIIDERTGKQPYAVVQLRQDNAAKSLYNMVGFQTNLKFGEQKRVFSLIPGLENCEFLRYGVMHRNTFINSPKLLDGAYSLRKNKNIFFAGQITGVEGYIESASSGFAAGVAAAEKILTGGTFMFPRFTVIGALAQYVSDAGISDFQPMGANFGLVEPPREKIKGGRKNIRLRMAEISVGYMENWIEGELGRIG